MFVKPELGPEGTSGMFGLLLSSLGVDDLSSVITILASFCEISSITLPVELVTMTF